MNKLISIVIVLLVGTIKLQGFNFSSVMSTVSTILFCGRKVGYFCKINQIITLEVAGIFLTVVMQLLMGKFDLWETLAVILARMLHVGVVYYDTKAYVYVTEEKRKDEK